MSLRSLYHFISSMKLGLVLLGLIGITAVLGSAVSPDYFYSTGLFKLLLALLLANLTFCTGRQITRTPGRVLGMNNSKPWYRAIGNLMIHIGIILVLVGGVINAYYGKCAEIKIAEGETVDMTSIVTTKEPVKLRLDEFSIEFNPDGSPSQYTSLVTIEKQGGQVNQYAISVNHPLNLAGIKAYQQSFGYLVKMQGTLGSDLPAEYIFEPGTAFYVPDSDRRVKIDEYVPNFDPDNTGAASLRPDNPVIIISVYENGKLLGTGATPFSRPIEISEGKYITFLGVKPFTVLRLKSDPGMPVAAAGGLVLMIGVCSSLIYRPPNKILHNSDVQEPGTLERLN
ncbi:MAG: cytochrome c biogenesis protein ResB [Syntrophomonas sp.]